MPFFKPRRAEPAQCQVDADPVIEGLYVLEQGERRLLVAVVGAGHGSGTRAAWVPSRASPLRGGHGGGWVRRYLPMAHGRNGNVAVGGKIRCIAHRNLQGVVSG